MNVVDSCGWLEFMGDGANAAFFAPHLLNEKELLIPGIVIFEVCKRLSLLGQSAAADAFLSVAERCQIAHLNPADLSLAAKASIKNPTPEHTRLAIKQSGGAITVLAGLEKAAAQEKLAGKDKQALEDGLKNARAAVNDYVQFLEDLEKKLDPTTARSFRVGKDLYEGKFTADIQSSLSAEQTYQRALTARDEAHNNMEKLADQLWDKTMGAQVKPADRVKKIAMVIDKLSEKHVDAKDR